MTTPTRAAASAAGRGGRRWGCVVMRLQSIRRTGRSPPRCPLPWRGPAPPCPGWALGAECWALDGSASRPPLRSFACWSRCALLRRGLLGRRRWSGDRRGDDGRVVVPRLDQRRHEVDAADLLRAGSSSPGRRTGRARTAAGRCWIRPELADGDLLEAQQDGLGVELVGHRGDHAALARHPLVVGRALARPGVPERVVAVEVLASRARSSRRSARCHRRSACGTSP